MRIEKINIINLKGFEETGDINISPSINIVIGPNNSGKSTIIKACYMIQPSGGDSWTQQYIIKNRRKMSTYSQVKVTFDNFDLKYIKTSQQIIDSTKIWEKAVRFKLEKNKFNASIPSILGKQDQGWPRISNLEPNNFLYPYFSKRKAVSFNESFNVSHAKTVKENLVDLYAKIDRISNVDYPAHKEFRKACKKILGFNVTCSLSSHGRQAGIIVSNDEYIPIDEMGEGTTNLLGLIVDLCISEDKLFLIEEIENDIHPKALKSLLELMINKSEMNQFIISTHSNIVTKYLGAIENSKIFYVDMKIKNRMPTSSIKEIKNTPIQRIKILEDLGYEMFDFELWKAYLILEESSAERIIREFLIPNYVPTLGNKIKTIAAQGVDDLEPRFNDFLRLFVFVHLSNAYKNKAWVIADGDEPGLKAINGLKSRFKQWKPNHFRNFNKPNFEDYYPDKWQKKAKEALSISDKKRKFKAKGLLVNQVMDWTISNKAEAKKEFRKSAVEIIEILKELDKLIN